MSESRLLGEVGPGFVVKLCGAKQGSGKCGRVARVYSLSRRKLLCDKCTDPVLDASTEPVAQDGVQFRGLAAGAPIDAVAVAKQMAEVAGG